MAAHYLQSNHYQVCHRNWRAGRVGEVDLIALTPDSKTLVFIEVKTRSSSRYGDPAESVTPAKQNTLFRVAEHYLYEHPFEGDIRFDVMSVLRCPDSHTTSSQDPFELTHVQNAFDAS